MGGCDLIEQAVAANSLARHLNQVLAARDNVRYIGLRYPARLCSGHFDGRAVFRLAGHRPFDRGRRIAAAGLAA